MDPWGVLFSFQYLQILENSQNKKVETEKRLGLEGNNDSLVTEPSFVHNWLLGLRAAGSGGQNAVLSEDTWVLVVFLLPTCCVTLSKSDQS